MEKTREQESDEWRDVGRTKYQTIENDKWERKEYTKKSNSGATKDIIQIKLHMWELKANYRRKTLDNRFPMYNQKRILQNMSWNVT